MNKNLLLGNLWRYFKIMKMDDLKGLLFAHAASAQILLFAVTITSLWLAEKLVSAEPADRKLKHTSVNALFILSALPIQLAFALLFTVLSHWATTHHWGLVYLLPNPSSLWIKYVLMFFVLDFLDYVYHVTMHQVTMFWRFHLVHHTDLKVDVSTNLREHPGETFIRNCFMVVWIFICGASFGVLFLRQAVQTVSNISSHTSFRLPPRLARVLGWVFITPNLHQVHHHFRMPHTNCNYGDVFSIWDRIFGTFSDLTGEDTVFGLDSHMDETINGNYLGIIAMPFRKPQAATRINPSIMRLRWSTLMAIMGLLFAAAPTHAEAPVFSYEIVHPFYGDIGTFTESIAKNTNSTQIDIRVRIAVKILGIIIYREEGDRREIFHGNRFVSLQSFTVTNGDRIDVSGEARGNHFVVTTHAGVINAPVDIFPSDPWMVKYLGVGTSVAIETGEILTTHVTDGGPARTSLQHVTVETRHFRASGENQQYDVWLNDHNVPLMFRSIEDGTPIDFILASPLSDAAHVENNLAPTVKLKPESEKH
jgi:sterol desaturase/sphingolipid hydroxylase (fatty acid hydroxylase superfamily)